MFKQACILIAVTTLSTSAIGLQILQKPSEAQTFDINIFPAAEGGMTRHVIRLPQVEDQQNYKVQLLPGSWEMVDCNFHGYVGSIDEKTLPGFGYKYYEVKRIVGPSSAMMACPNNAKKREFVTMRGQSLIEYNDRLPIVVYTPGNIDVRYKVWETDESSINSTKE